MFQRFRFCVYILFLILFFIIGQDQAQESKNKKGKDKKEKIKQDTTKVKNKADSVVVVAPQVNFSATISASKEEYQLGERIEIKLIVENKGKENRKICTYTDDDLFDLEISGPDKELIRPEMVVVKRLVQKDIVAEDFKNIAPGLGHTLFIYGLKAASGNRTVFSRKMKLVEKRVYLDKPGVYLVKAFYDVNSPQYNGKKFDFDAWTGRLESNTIRLTMK